MADVKKKIKELIEIAEKTPSKIWYSKVWCGDEGNWTATGPVYRQHANQDELDPDSIAGKKAALDSDFITTLNPEFVRKLLEAWLEMYEEIEQVQPELYTNPVLEKAGKVFE